MSDCSVCSLSPFHSFRNANRVFPYLPPPPHQNTFRIATLQVAFSATPGNSSIHESFVLTIPNIRRTTMEPSKNSQGHGTSQPQVPPRGPTARPSPPKRTHPPSRPNTPSRPTPLTPSAPPTRPTTPTPPRLNLISAATVGEASTSSRPPGDQEQLVSIDT